MEERNNTLGVAQRGPADRVKVLHVITRMVVGGAQQNTLLTVEHLDRARFSVALASGPGGGPEGSLEPAARSLGVPYFEIASLVRSPHPAKDVAAFVSLLGLMRRGRYHIVHTHTTKAGILGRLAARAVGVPIVIHTPHGHAFQGYLGTAGSWLLVLLERALAKITDRIVCLTNAELEDHLRIGVGRPGQYVVIHSGVDVQDIMATQIDAPRKRLELGLPPQGLLVGCVARLVPVKGLSTLIRAIPAVLNGLPDVTFVVVGDGPERAELEEQASALKVRDRIVFLGLRHDIPELLPLFQLLVLPSWNEGMGKAAVEAMAAGRPVVGSRVAGIQNVIQDGETGFLVTPGNSEELARAVIALLRNPTLRAAMGDSGRTRAAGYGIPAMVDQISRLYETVIKEKIEKRFLPDLQDVHTI